MADKYSGWLAEASVSTSNSTNTSLDISVEVRFRSAGWRYDMGPVYGWANINGTSYKTADGVNVDTTANNQMYVSLGTKTLTITKTHSNQTIPCKAIVTSESTYVSGTKESAVQNISVPAKPSYSITYNSNATTGVTGMPSNQTKWYGESLTLSSATPSRTGYTFGGWYANTGGSGTNYSGASYTTNASLTLYAKWTIKSYTITFNKNASDATAGSTTSGSKNYGGSYTIPSTASPSRTNYTFKGWATSSTGSVVYASGSSYTADANITLYAVWELSYVKPRITSFSAIRATTGGSASNSGLNIKVTYTWATDKTVSSSSKIQYKKSTDSSWTNVTISPALSGTSGSAVTQTFGSDGISLDNSYDVRIYIVDSGGSSYSSIVTVPSQAYIIDVRPEGKGIAFGKAAEADNYIQSNWHYKGKYIESHYNKFRLDSSGQSSDQVYMEFYKNDARGAYIGFGSTGGTNFYFNNENGGHFLFNKNIRWATQSLNSVNYNDYTYASTYYMGTGCTNAPASLTYCKLFVMGAGGSSGDVVQLAVANGSGRAFIRIRNGSTWSAWREIVTDAYGQKSDNINNIVQTEFRYSSNTANHAIAQNGYVHTYFASSNYAIQDFIPYTGNVKWRRSKTSGTWGNWIKVDGHSAMTLYHTGRPTSSVSTAWTEAVIGLNQNTNFGSGFTYSSNGIKANRDMTCLVSATVTTFECPQAEFDVTIYNTTTNTALAGLDSNTNDTLATHTIAPRVVTLASGDVIKLKFTPGTTGTYKFIGDTKITTLTAIEL